MRCRPGPNRRAALQSPGQLNQTFAAAAVLHQYDPEVLSSDPWVIVFHNFVSDDEVAALINHGGQEWTQSVDGACSIVAFCLSPCFDLLSSCLTAGRRLPNGSFASVLSKSRTSKTSWCTREACESNQLISQVTQRIAEVSGVPYENSEYLQVISLYPMFSPIF